MCKRLLCPLLLLLFLIYFIMVSCNAPGCTWEKVTGDSRGLNRHRATCKLFRKSSIASCQKRQERAKEAALVNLVRLPAVTKRSLGSSSVSRIFYICHSQWHPRTRMARRHDSSNGFLEDIAHSASGECPLKTYHSVPWPQIIGWWPDRGWHGYYRLGGY